MGFNFTSTKPSRVLLSRFTAIAKSATPDCCSALGGVGAVSSVDSPLGFTFSADSQNPPCRRRSNCHVIKWISAYYYSSTELLNGANSDQFTVLLLIRLLSTS